MYKQGGNMIFSMMLSVLSITTDYGIGIVKLNEVQAIELVDKDSGGILTFTLKGDKSEQIVFVEHTNDSWNEAKEWFQEHIYVVQEAMVTTDITRTSDVTPQF
tara:strand:- start:231 stop:539 length:309 start_codon:yes stop_codon:yes gene_type:complete